MPQPTTASAYLQTLGDLQSLPDNWNEQGAPSPNETAIESARQILLLLDDSELDPVNVTASAEGGVSISFLRGSRYADIECFNDGEVIAITSNRSDQPQAWNVVLDREEILQCLERIRTFLGG